MKNPIEPRRSRTAWRLAVALLVVAATTASAATWQAQGPGPNTNGQVEGILDGEVVGAIHAVAPHPTDADILYAGGVNGGVWKTTNATATNPNWVHLTADQASSSISSIDIDPADSDTLLVGIGRYSSFGRSGGDRAGLLRSTDAGATWTLIDGGGTITGINVSSVASRGTTLVFSANDGSDTGVFRSTDTGATWTKVSDGDGTATGMPAGTAFYMAGNRGEPTRLFTSIVNAEVSGGVNGVYRSTDTGATWAKVSNPTMDAQITTGVTNNLEIAVGTSDNVYAGIINSGGLAGIYRSGDGGDTWTAMDIPSDGVVGIHPGGQGAIHFSLAADLSDANRVYIGGDRQAFPNGVGAADFSGRLFRGNAAAAPGSQWAHLTHRNDLGPAGGGTANNSAPHADSRGMAMDAAGNLIQSDDGGIYKRTSPADNTGDWFSINGDIQTTEFHDSAYDANSDITMGGAQDTGSSAQIASGGVRWLSISTADGGDVAVDDTSTPGFSTRYSSFQGFQAFRRQVFDASNTFQSQALPALTVLGGGQALAAHFSTPIALNAVTQTRLIIGANNGVYESLDQGDTITQLSPIFSVNGTFSQPLAYGVPGNPDLIYAGSGTNVWIRNGNTITPFTQSASYPGSATVRHIVIDPGNPAAAYVVDSATVYQTLDTGATWTEVGAQLAGLGAGTLRTITYMETPLGDGLAVGGTGGVFAARESDGFLDWETVGDGLPSAPVFDLDYHAATDLLVAGTLGNGAWEVSPPLELPAELFADDFDSGNTDAWSFVNTGSPVPADGPSK